MLRYGIVHTGNGKVDEAVNYRDPVQGDNRISVLRPDTVLVVTWHDRDAVCVEKDQQYQGRQCRRRVREHATMVAKTQWMAATATVVRRRRQQR